MGTKFIKGLEGRDVKVRPLKKRELIRIEHDFNIMHKKIKNKKFAVELKKQIVETLRQVKIMYGNEYGSESSPTRLWKPEDFGIKKVVPEDIEEQAKIAAFNWSWRVLNDHDK